MHRADDKVRVETELREHLYSQVEISLQPWEAFRPDGVILFSDILTPLAGMGIEFDIVKGKGPIITDPIRSMEVPLLSRCSCSTYCVYVLPASTIAEVFTHASDLVMSSTVMIVEQRCNRSM